MVVLIRLRLFAFTNYYGLAQIVKSEILGPIQYAPTWRFIISNQLPRTLAQGIQRPPPEQSNAAVSASGERADAAHDFPPNTCWVLVKDGSLGFVGNALPTAVLIRTPVSGGFTLLHGTMKPSK